MVTSSSERLDVWERCEDGFRARLNIRICEQQIEVSMKLPSGFRGSVDEVNGIGAPDQTWYVSVGEDTSDIHALLEFTEFQ